MLSQASKLGDSKKKEVVGAPFLSSLGLDVLLVHQLMIVKNAGFEKGC